MRHSMGLGISAFWRYVASTTAAASRRTDGAMGSPASTRNAMSLSPSNSRTESSGAAEAVTTAGSGSMVAVTSATPSSARYRSSPRTTASASPG
ncbi:hypothetical protein ABZX95_29060 [Streptomyces sp. NPDC004232]|uniref:hypothetical protein n=1 Tax=Streptomyces sp. NPDC004232 TaxID=3154454 RepID=UPI0033ACCC2B